MSIKIISLVLYVLIGIWTRPMLSVPLSQQYHHRDVATIKSTAQQLFKSLESKDYETFQKSFDAAYQRYRNNRRSMDRLLALRDQNGMTLLMNMALYGDSSNLVYLLDRLKGYYADDINALFNYINAREPQRNRTALILSTYNRDPKVLKILVEKFDSLIDRDPDLFYRIITAHDSIYKLSPLASLVFESSTENVKFLIAKALERFGSDKAKFNRFINQQNGIGLTPLALALETNIKAYLRNLNQQGYEVHEYPPKTRHIPKLKEAFEKGYDLLHAVQNDNVEETKKILNYALSTYTTPKTFFGFITRRNGEGWNALINAAADGKKEYIGLLIEAMNKGLAEDKELIFDLLNSVDNRGMSALNMAIDRHQYAIARDLLHFVVDIAGNKNDFFRFINTHDEINGYTPLIQAAYNSEEIDDEAYQTIALMIELAERYFGKDSRTFNLFINARDNNNQTALDYIRNPQIKNLLLQYGAIE